MPVDRGKPRLFHRATEWKKCMEDFFHGQLGDPGPFWQVAGIVQPTLQQNARKTHKTKPRVTKRALIHSGLHKT